MPRLSDNDKHEILRCIAADQPLPDRFRFLLFEDKREAELVWNGKTREVCDAALPFRTMERIGETASDKKARREADKDLPAAWHNKLIRGDNRLILSSLRDGPLRQDIEAHGGLKLIYIDPPFDVGADFAMEVGVPDGEIPQAGSLRHRHIAYRDTWGDGADSFIAMIYERLILMRELLSEDGSIFVHCDWRVSGAMRQILDEIFGKENLRNEIVWVFTGPGSPGMRQFNRKHNMIYWYSKSKDHWIFNEQAARVPHHAKTSVNFKAGLEGSGFRAGTYALPDGKIPESWWEMAIAQRFPIDGVKRVGYPTEKPWALVERIIRSCSGEGDLVADFFCGGGIVPAVAETLERKWIAADLGQMAIHTTRKRMSSLQRKRREEGEAYRAFEVLHLAGSDIPEASLQDLVLRAYGAERSGGSPVIQGKKDERWVSVGPLGAPVTRTQMRDILRECRRKRIRKVDILGFEFEAESFRDIIKDAKEKGINIALKVVPAEIFDKRAIEKNQTVFHDLCDIEFEIHVRKSGAGSLPAISVEITGFSNLRGTGKMPVPHFADARRTGKMPVLHASNESIRHWADWVDDWAVDFNYGSSQEDTFVNDWESFRTNKGSALNLKSAFHECKRGCRKIAVKVVDILGNETMRRVEVDL